MKTLLHYHAHKSPRLEPTASQLNPVHTLTLHFFKIHFNVIFPIQFAQVVGSFQVFPITAPQYNS
jgi:hypothetical protein